MSTWLAMLIGFAGTVLSLAVVISLFDEWWGVHPRPPFDWLGLIFALVLNVSGWLLAVIWVDG